MAAGSAKRRSPRGETTADLVLSACSGTNAELFPQILDLYVSPGSVVADVTYGKGVFWRNVPEGRYKLLASDIQNGIDCRKLPYEPASVDCLVVDPPYMHSSGGTAYQTPGSSAAFASYYRNDERGYGGHERVLQLYLDAVDEATRVLCEGGILIVKCQDEVCALRQRLTHVEIINSLVERGWFVEDLFVLVRTGRPVASRVVRQRHARKNHSYFIIARNGGSKFWKGPCGPGVVK